MPASRDGTSLVCHAAILFLLPLVAAFAAPAAAACQGTAGFFVYGNCAQAPVRSANVGALFGRGGPQHSGSWTTTVDRRTGAVHAFAEARPVDRGGPVAARMTVRCLDDNTSLYFTFAGRQMGDKGQQREFVYAVDDGGEGILELERGTDHAVMGVWQGYRAVPLLRELGSGNRLRISAIAADGADIRVDFDVSGLAAGLADLRHACHW